MQSSGNKKPAETGYLDKKSYVTRLLVRCIQLSPSYIAIFNLTNHFLPHIGQIPQNFYQDGQK